MVGKRKRGLTVESSARKTIKRAWTHAFDEGFNTGFKIASERKERHGHWIASGDHLSYCSVCRKKSLWPFGDYCKWCGAKMDEEGKK